MSASVEFIRFPLNGDNPVLLSAPPMKTSQEFVDCIFGNKPDTDSSQVVETFQCLWFHFVPSWIKDLCAHHDVDSTRLRLLIDECGSYKFGQHPLFPNLAGPVVLAYEKLDEDDDRDTDFDSIPAPLVDAILHAHASIQSGEMKVVDDKAADHHAATTIMSYLQAGFKLI